MRLGAVLAFALLTTVAPRASAFCGFYVGSASGSLSNGATEVVLARTGTHTVLSMRNDYHGPAADFAMVVPVPVVLQKDAVKTLPKSVFEHVDMASAPRLVETWQEDPCYGARLNEAEADDSGRTRIRDVEGQMMAPLYDSKRVKVEAEFAVGEYEIVILSAEDSLGLDAWLREKGYHIPDGAEAYLRPYVSSGSKFFVAKVDASRVVMDGDRAVLSPLRFEYDEEAFRLPVRLGLINSAGKQDLIIHVFAPERYEAANAANVAVPTNIDVEDFARDRFPEVYAGLFDAALASRPRAVVTEYAWSSLSCDPCPAQPLDPKELALLGVPNDYRVHTRMHARYDKDSLGEDLVFRVAPPIVGGQEGMGQGAAPGKVNAFQARYVLRHFFRGPVTCADPDFYEWGGPPDRARAEGALQAARGLDNAPRGMFDLSTALREPVPSLGLRAGAPPAEPHGASRFALGLGLGAGAGLFGVLGVFLASARGRGARRK